MDRPRERGEESGETEIGVGLRSSALLPFSALQGRCLLGTFYWQPVPAPRRSDWLAQARKPAPISCCAPGARGHWPRSRAGTAGWGERDREERKRKGSGGGDAAAAEWGRGRRCWKVLQPAFFSDLWTLRPQLRLPQSHSGLGSCCLTVQRFSRRGVDEKPEPQDRILPFCLLSEILGAGWDGGRQGALVRPGERHGSQSLEEPVFLSGFGEVVRTVISWLKHKCSVSLIPCRGFWGSIDRRPVWCHLVPLSTPRFLRSAKYIR